MALTAVAWWTHPWDALRQPSVKQHGTPVTAQVEETTLTNQLRLNASLTYGDPIALPSASGTITVLPASGTVVKQGQQVYEMDGRAIVLFQGARPFWRALAVGAEPGRDIEELEENLATLGFFPGKPDETFDWATRQALRDWQKSLSLTQTGMFSPSDVVLADAPGIRISQVTAALGQQGASPATYTDTTLRAVAKLSDAQLGQLTVGTPVTVVLPDNSEITATLSALDPGGQPIEGSDQTTSPTATIDFTDQTTVAQAGPVPVRLVVGDGKGQTNTLVVPVTALLATPDGGYAVDVVVKGTIVRTPVLIGLVADARAQILHSGSDVEGKAGPVLAVDDQVVLSQ